MVKVDTPLHYDSLFLNQTCYNFVDDWTEKDYENDVEEKIIEFMFFNEENIFSGDSGSGEPDGEGSG